MPQIKEFEAGAGAFRPTETGVEARAAAARRIGSEYNEVGGALRELGRETSEVGTRAGRATALMGQNIGEGLQVAGGVAVNYLEHREISQGAAALSGFLDAKTKAWNDTVKNADPNDTTIAQTFRESLEEDFAKLKDGFLTDKGRQFAENHIETMRNHFFQKTASDMSSLASQALKVNVAKTSNSLSSAAMRSGDFHSVDYLLKSVDDTVAGLVGSSPNIKGADSNAARMSLTQTMKEHIVKSGAVGAVQNSPDPEATAKAWAEKYPDFLDGSDIKQLASNAKAQVRAQRTQEAYLSATAKKELQANSDKRVLETIDALRTDPKSVNATDIINSPDITRKDKEHLLKIIDRHGKPETARAVSATELRDLVDRIHAPLDDPRRMKTLDEVNEAYGAGKLTFSDFQRARKEFTTAQTDEGQTLGRQKVEFLKGVAPVISQRLNPLDQSGHLSVYEFSKAVDRKVDEYRRSGKDPYDLFDPTKPDYLGKPEVLKTYQTPLATQVQQAAQPKPAPAPSPPVPTGSAGATPVTPNPVNTITVRRNPGETIDDWRKRTGR